MIPLATKIMFLIFTLIFGGVQKRFHTIVGKTLASFHKSLVESIIDQNVLEVRNKHVFLTNQNYQ